MMRDLCEAIEDGDTVSRPIKHAGLLLRVAFEIGFVEECEDGLALTERGREFLGT
jgi:hypothetical protein